MNITIFSCSTGFHCYDSEHKDTSGNSYVEKLERQFIVQGRWMDGFTILHLEKEIPVALKGNDRHFIINIGAVEAFTYPSENIIEWQANYLQHYGCDAAFKCYCVPIMCQAAHSLTHKIKAFYPIIYPDAFSFLFGILMNMLQGSKVIVIGMSKPNVGVDHPWFSQADNFNRILREAAEKENQTFIDTWNLIPTCIVDNNHINIEGHKILFNKIMEVLQCGKSTSLHLQV